MKLLFFVFLAAAAAREAERSCAVRNAHFHHQIQQHASAGTTTGLSWLETAAPKSSVFAPLPETTNNSAQSHPNNWNPPAPEKSPIDNPQYPRSPAKHETTVPCTSVNTTSANDCSKNTESGRSRGSNLESTPNTSSTGATYLKENNFYAYPTPPKEETEAGIPLTPTSVMSSSSATRQVQQTASNQSSSDRKSVSSSDQSQQAPVLEAAQNQQVYQQLGVESKLPPTQVSSSVTNPYSQPYKPVNSGEYGNSASSSQSTEGNKTTLTTYMNKNKSKNKQTTG